MAQCCKPAGAGLRGEICMLRETFNCRLMICMFLRDAQEMLVANSQQFFLRMLLGC